MPFTEVPKSNCCNHTVSRRMPFTDIATDGSAGTIKSSGWGMAGTKLTPAALLLSLTLLAYFPALWGGFIWDDDFYVTGNETLLSLEGLWQVWYPPTTLPPYYPLVHTSFWIEYHLWGLNPLGYHIDNVLLHAAGSVLLWRLLRRLQLPGAWVAAAVFALHPVHVESVAWIT